MKDMLKDMSVTKIMLIIGIAVNVIWGGYMTFYHIRQDKAWRTTLDQLQYEVEQRDNYAKDLPILRSMLKSRTKE